MKAVLTLTVLLGAMTLQAAEPLEVPSFVKTFEELSDAQKEAAESKKGLAFLLMEPGST